MCYENENENETHVFRFRKTHWAGIKVKFAIFSFSLSVFFESVGRKLPTPDLFIRVLQKIQSHILTILLVFFLESSNIA